MEPVQYRFEIGILTGQGLDIRYLTAVDVVDSADASGGGFMTFPGVDGNPVFMAQRAAVAYVHRLHTIDAPKPEPAVAVDELAADTAEAVAA